MIPVQELCIGNWVYDGERTQFPMQVVGIGTDYVYLDFEGNEGDLWESKPEDLQGIPINECLLKKMGFWRVPKTDYYELQFHKDDTREIRCAIVVSLKEGKTSVMEYKEPKLLIEGTLCEWHPSSTARIECFHELQNLFYQTTKKELKINL